MTWFDSLPAAEAQVPCGTGTHTVRWEAGRLTLLAHPDAEAEQVLGALGGDKAACVALTQTWARHCDDLAVLTAGPRSAADRVSVDWGQIAELRAQLPGGQPVPGKLPRALLYGGGLRPAPAMAEVQQRQQRHIELLELLALGAEFQVRLAGTVIAAWAGAERASDRAGRRPELSGVLTGRFAPAARKWLGIDQDTVTVTPHDGPGWGALDLGGAGRSRRLRASLPFGWLADVWACGLAVVSGHLVVRVEQPGYPRARVLALAAPDTEPVPLQVRATGSSAGGMTAWTL